MNRTTSRRSLKYFSLRVTCGQRHIQIDFQAGDPAGLVLGHEFSDIHLETFHREILAACDNSHDRGHARTERGGYQIGGGKRLSAAVVVHRRIGRESAA